MKLQTYLTITILLAPCIVMAGYPNAPMPPDRQDVSAHLVEEWTTAFENLLEQPNLTKEQEQIIGHALNMSTTNLFEIEHFDTFNATTGQAIRTLMEDIRSHFSEDQYISLRQSMPSTQSFLLSINAVVGFVCNCGPGVACPNIYGCAETNCLRATGSPLMGICHQGPVQ